VSGRPVLRVLSALRASGLRPQRSASGWMAKCPGHDDVHASLSVSEGSDGRALLHCHAGCAAEHILAVLGLKLADLFPPEPEARPQIVVTYPYRDEAASLLFEVVRFDPKDFRQRRPSPGGGWMWKVGGVRRVPYRLPELLASSPDSIVFVPEGERDVDNLRALGAVATTNAGGAGKWRRELSEHLHGRHVVVLPDHDAPGRAHAEAVAKALSGVAASVRVLDLPDLPEKGDVSDWLNGGGTLERLRELASATPVWAPEAMRPKPAKTPNREPQGDALGLESPEPADVSVNGEQLFAEIVTTLKRYLVLPPHSDVAIALWIALTYLTDVVEVLPRLLFTSPTKACGKTRALAVVGGLVTRPLHAASITPAALFRVIAVGRPTLLLDEMDNSRLNDNDELRAVLNSGHTRTSASVVRNVSEGRKWEPKRFSTWAASVFAAIGKLPDTVTSRCICVPMRRRAPGQPIALLRESRLLADLEPLRRGLARWAMDHADEVKTAEPRLPETMDDRPADNWSPLLAIADAIGGAWPEIARKAALALSGASEDDDAGVMLLTDLRELVEERGLDCDRYPSAEIVDWLKGHEERPWGEWQHGKPMSANALSKLLGRFGVKPRTIRMADGKTLRGYYREHLESAWAPYLPVEPQQPQQPAPIAAQPLISGMQHSEPVAASRSGLHPHEQRAVAPVVVSEPQTEPESVLLRRLGSSRADWDPVTAGVERRTEREARESEPVSPDLFPEVEQ